MCVTWPVLGGGGAGGAGGVTLAVTCVLALHAVLSGVTPLLAVALHVLTSVLAALGVTPDTLIDDVPPVRDGIEHVTLLPAVPQAHPAPDAVTPDTFAGTASVTTIFDTVP